MSHSQASVLFFKLVTTDTQHTLQLWGPHPAPGPWVQCSWDTAAHESFLIFPQVVAQISLTQVCSTHCSRKPDICASFHTAGKLSHFPRIYLPAVREGVLAKLLRKQLGKTLGVLRTFRGMADGEGKENKHFLSLSCVPDTIYVEY